jgi:hypothetical protein
MGMNGQDGQEVELVLAQTLDRRYSPEVARRRRGTVWRASGPAIMRDQGDSVRVEDLELDRVRV